jgi:glyoxylase-like metal-dependent hydrolase (beta-lactamase superfamily II)
MFTPDRRRVLSAAAFALLAGPTFAQGRSAAPADFAGRVFVNERGGLRIHTYLAPPQGALVTSHIIETASSLILVDGQFQPAPALEAKRYLDTLGKPVRRVLLSHQHPDHWFGFHHMRVGPIHAGPTTAAFLRQNGAAVVAERRADSSVPEIAGVLESGETTIDGVLLRLRRVADTEAPEIMVIEVPQAGAAIVQDLVYNKVHVVVSRQIDEWVAALRAIERTAGELPLVLAGHGEPAGLGDLPGLIAYLEAVKPLLVANIGREQAIPEIVAEMSRRFPDYRVPPLLQLGLTRALRA